MVSRLGEGFQEYSGLLGLYPSSQGFIFKLSGRDTKVLIRETNTEDKKCNRNNTDEEVTAVRWRKFESQWTKPFQGFVNHIPDFHVLTLRLGSYSTS